MSSFDALLACRARVEGRAIRRAVYRHRHLADAPMAVVLYQLGAEWFSFAAAGFGTAPGDRHMVCAGDPRVAPILFDAAEKLAEWFNPLFESHAADREEFRVSDRVTRQRARTAPQVVVANEATAHLLGRLGRRFAYARQASVAVRRLGRHLVFLRRRFDVRGQQLLVDLTGLLRAHWATAMSPAEEGFLGTLDAWIAPRPGASAYETAAEAEAHPVGPQPAAEADKRLDPILQQFHRDRRGATSRGGIAAALPPIHEHFGPMLRRTWDLLWRCLERERAEPEAPSVQWRWDADRDAYTRHIDHLERGGHVRFRETHESTNRDKQELEEAERRTGAQEVCDDPRLMIRLRLANRAIRGRVVSADPANVEPANGRALRRPLVVVETPDPSLMPTGKEMFRADMPDAPCFVVEAVERVAEKVTRVTLKQTERVTTPLLPAVGDEACFCDVTTAYRPPPPTPARLPWTHVAPAEPEPASLEELP